MVITQLNEDGVEREVCNTYSIKITKLLNKSHILNNQSISLTHFHTETAHQLREKFHI